MCIRDSFWSVLVAVSTMTAGSAFLMWIGERITENGIGNGISIVLLFNIVSSIPQDVNTLYAKFMSGKIIAVQVVTAIIMLAIMIAMVVFVVILQDGCLLYTSREDLSRIRAKVLSMLMRLSDVKLVRLVRNN